MSHRYLEIAAELREQIMSGAIPEGTRLPGMTALSRRYGTGSGVTREAVAVLELEGLVVIRERSGAFVQSAGDRQRLDVGRQVRRNDLGYVFAKPAGHWSPIGTPRREWVPCPAEIAELLDVEPGTDVLARHRVVGPGTPIQITTTYLPDDLARGTVLEQANTGPGGWIDRLEQDMGYGPLRWDAEVSTRLPTEEEAEELGISSRLPVLVLHRTHTDPAGRTVGVDVVVVDGRRFSVGVPISRAASARWPTQPATARNTPQRGDTPTEEEVTSRPTGQAAP